MKSLEFVKQRILEGHTGLDWTEDEIDAAEVQPFSAFMDSKNMPRSCGDMKAEKRTSADTFSFTTYIDGLKDDGQPKSAEKADIFPSVSVQYTPENDFDYFASETFESDGTYAFFLDALSSILQRIDTGVSYNKEKAADDFLKHPSLYHVRYEVGDVVIMRSFKR